MLQRRTWPHWPLRMTGKGPWLEWLPLDLPVCKCNICNEAFSCHHDLSRHKHVHNRDTLYICDVCNLAFSSAGNLRTHKNVRVGIRRFMCDICNKGFHHLNHLTEHKCIHGAKPHHCDVCNVAFCTTSSLNRHRYIQPHSRSFISDIWYTSALTAVTNHATVVFVIRRLFDSESWLKINAVNCLLWLYVAFCAADTGVFTVHTEVKRLSS